MTTEVKPIVSKSPIRIYTDENGQPRVEDATTQKPIPWVSRVEIVGTVSGWSVVLHVFPGFIDVVTDKIEVREDGTD